MWLSNSSVGRKTIMALSGAFLVLFVTFHCLMNAVAICWPAAYNSVCEFLGANWYALLASVILACFVLIHIFYAVMLTLQNRKARGHQRYLISKKPATVEWSSQNMLVLGIVILAFLVVHLIQFWAKMQLQEIRGGDEMLPPAAGTLFLQKAFELPWTLIVYGIGFLALWFHLNHGFWSMFQSVGWNNTNWMPRLKKIGLVWTTFIVALFFAEAIVFTIKAHEKYYLTDETLREQYKDMIIPMIEKDFGPDAAALGQQISVSPYGNVSMGLRQLAGQLANQLEQLNSPEAKMMIQQTPQAAEQIEQLRKQHAVLENIVKLFDYLESYDNKPDMNFMGMPGGPQGAPQGQPQPQAQPQGQPQGPQGQPQGQPQPDQVQQAPQGQPAPQNAPATQESKAPKGKDKAPQQPAQDKPASKSNAPAADPTSNLPQ